MDKPESDRHPHPASFPIASIESRAAARALLTGRGSNRMISHIPRPAHCEHGVHRGYDCAECGGIAKTIPQCPHGFDAGHDCLACGGTAKIIEARDGSASIGRPKEHYPAYPARSS